MQLFGEYAAWRLSAWVIIYKLLGWVNVALRLLGWVNVA